MAADPVLLVVAGALVLLGLSSRVVKRHSLSPVLLAVGAGVLVGPRAFGWIDPTTVVPRGELLEQLARVALALAVFDITLRSRPQDLRRNARRIGVLLLVVMPGMWLITALGAGILLGLSLPLALLLGAALTPTDPGVASALVTGVLPNRSLPRRVRMSLQVEAAANDGLALPFVVFAGVMATVPGGEVLPQWLAEVGRQLAVAVVVGGTVGFGLKQLTDLAGVDRLAEEDWFPLAGAGVALATLALAHLLGGTGIFAAFIAGLAFSEGLPHNLREPIHLVHRSITKVGLTLVFLVFGMVLPIDAWWPELGLAGVLFGLWVLVLRRFPVAFPTMLATGAGRMSAAFIGWSGPLGVAGIYYLAFMERYGLPEYERLFLAGTLAITASILGQALTSSPTVNAYRHAAGTEAAEGHEVELGGRLP